MIKVKQDIPCIFCSQTLCDTLYKYFLDNHNITFICEYACHSFCAEVGELNFYKKIVSKILTGTASKSLISSPKQKIELELEPKIIKELDKLCKKNDTDYNTVIKNFINENHTETNDL